MELYNRLAIAGSIKIDETHDELTAQKIHNIVSALQLDSYWFDDEKTLLEVYGVCSDDAIKELETALGPLLDNIYAAEFILTPEYIFNTSDDGVFRLSLKNRMWLLEPGRIIMETEYSALDHYKTALYNYACFDLNVAEPDYVYNVLSENGHLTDGEIIELGLGYLVKEGA